MKDVNVTGRNCDYHFMRFLGPRGHYPNQTVGGKKGSTKEMNYDDVKGIRCYNSCKRSYKNGCCQSITTF